MWFVLVVQESLDDTISKPVQLVSVIGENKGVYFFIYFILFNTFGLHVTSTQRVCVCVCECSYSWLWLKVKSQLWWWIQIQNQNHTSIRKLWQQISFLVLTFYSQRYDTWIAFKDRSRIEMQSIYAPLKFYNTYKHVIIYRLSNVWIKDRIPNMFVSM